MTRSSSQRTRAIVLRRTNFGEADRILALLTPEGQQSVIARGVRRERSKLAGGIELFAISDVTIHHGRGKLGVLTSARLEHFFEDILTDYERLQCAYEATHTITKLSSDADSEEWFSLLENVYGGLSRTDIPLQLVQVWLYVRLAEHTGYALSLERDVAGAALSAEETYMYDTQERGLRPSRQGNITADHIKFLRLVASKPLLAVAQIGGVEQILPDCWLLARSAAAL